MNFRPFFSDNPWWGKILGGFFGFLTAGPAGALFGILIGNFFDKGLVHQAQNPLWTYHHINNKSVQSIFFEATFAIMGYVAKADGRISEKAIQMATQLMDEMSLNPAQRTMAKEFFRQGKTPHYDTGKLLTILQRSCHGNPELLKLFMEIQYKVAQASGFSKGKIVALDIVFSQLGFAPLRDQPRFYQESNFHWSYSSSQSNRNYNNYSSQPPPRPQSSLAAAYAILEVTPDATRQEIKCAYRKLMSRNHPDKLIAQGLPEAMIKIANDKTQKITKAYEEICRSKGW